MLGLLDFWLWKERTDATRKHAPSVERGLCEMWLRGALNCTRSKQRTCSPFARSISNLTLWWQHQPCNVNHYWLFIYETKSRGTCPFVNLNYLYEMQIVKKWQPCVCVLITTAVLGHTMVSNQAVSRGQHWNILHATFIFIFYCRLFFNLYW